MSESDEALNGINAFVSGAVLFVVAVVVNGVAARWMWLWFVVPLGVPAITTAHAIGLVSLMRFVNPGGKKADEPILHIVGKSLVFTAICVGMGFIVSRFM